MMNTNRLDAFRGALAALGEGVTTVDDHTLAVGNTTLVFDGERIVVPLEQPAVAERIARLGSIFRIAVVTPDGVPIATTPTPAQNERASLVTIQAPRSIIDEIIEQAALIERSSPTSARFGIPNIEAMIALAAAIVRIRFYSIPPEYARVKLGGALVQIVRVTDAAGIGTRVALPTRAPAWFDRTLTTLGWQIQGSAGVEYARAPFAKPR
jgi:hypothetical protein